MPFNPQKSIVFIIIVIIPLFAAAFPEEKYIPVLQSENFNINLIGSISEADDIIQNDSFFANVWDIIVGKEDQKLIKPFSILIGMAETMYVLDQGACKIQMYNTQNNSSSILHFPELISLIDMTLLADSSVIFSDSRHGRIFRLMPGEDDPSLFITDRRLHQPTGLTCNSITGDVWIVETASHRISIFDRQGNFIKHVGDRGVKAGQFNYPTFISMDHNQKVYVVDSMNHRIQIFDSQGNIITAFGQVGDGSGDMALPKGIACDMYGHIYIVDGLFHTVQIFDQQGNYLAHFGRQGQSPGEFWMPAGIYVDGKNKIYVADTYNSRIQIFQLEAVN